MKTKRMDGAISIDTDSLDIVYSAFKKKRIGEKDVTYKNILPRYLEFLKEKKVNATFFVIGSHIKNPYHKSLLRRIVDEGHELANHTFNHYFNFSRLPLDKKEEEIVRCEKLIEKTTGIKPVGFRAPGWDIDSETMKIIEGRGYLYDSSVFPSFFRTVYLVYLFMLNRGKPHSISMGSLWNSFAPLKQYHPNLDKIHIIGNSKIIELPINVTPISRIPFFGSVLFATKSRFLFNYSLKSVYGSNVPLNYELHTIELYDKENDLSNKKIEDLRHPCIFTNFKKKIELYDYAFKGFSKYYNLSTIRNMLENNKK